MKSHRMFCPHLIILAKASSYDHYADQLRLENVRRTQYNVEVAYWLSKYHQQPTIATIYQILNLLPASQSSLKQLLTAKLADLHYLETATHWFAEQTQINSRQMNHRWGLSAQARMARKKYKLLTQPTPQLYQYMRYHDPDFHQKYLDFSARPELSINRIPYVPRLKRLSPVEFHKLYPNP